MANKKNVTVTIVMDELLYDITNETYLRGRTLQNDTNHKEVASMFASMDDENQDKILRSIQRGFSEIKAELAEYLSEDASSTNNRLIDGTSDLTIALTMPSNFNEAATAGIAEAAHDYIRNIAVGDWYLVTNKQDAADYATLAGRSMENIRKSVSKRSRPMRRLNATGNGSEA